MGVSFEGDKGNWENVMGLRLRKSIKILPGVKLNISKSGISTSIGVRGAIGRSTADGTNDLVNVSFPI